jgi:hypothetical protein
VQSKALVEQFNLVHNCIDLQEVVSITRSRASLSPISDRSVWNQVLQLVPFWEAVLGNPLQIDISQWHNLLHPAPDTIDTSKAHFYCRFKVFPNIQLFRDALNCYMKHRNADIPFAVLLLSATGTPLADMKNAVTVAFAHSLKLNLDSDLLIPLVDSLCYDAYSLHIDHTKPITLPYFGYTIAGTSYSRLQDDLQNKWRRFCNFTTCTKSFGLDWLDFYIPLLDSTVSSSKDIRTVPRLGQIESIGIASLKGLSLNSASGGWRCEYTPKLEFSSLVHTCISTARSTISVDYTPAPDLSKKICDLLDDEVNFIFNSFIPFIKNESGIGEY